MVGNIMIECLLRTRKHWETIELGEKIDAFYNQKPIVATFHRPENVDNPGTLQRIIDILIDFAGDYSSCFSPFILERNLHWKKTAYSKSYKTTKISCSLSHYSYFGVF